MERLCMGCMQKYEDSVDCCPHCGYVHGTPPREAYHIVPGSMIADKYIVGKVLGFGGFGITYIAYDTVLDLKVAIKEYMPGEFSTRMPGKLPITIYSGEREEQFNEGLLKVVDEAQRLAKFNKHDGIVHILDEFRENNTAYIVMEYLEGESLKELLAREGKMPVDRAFGIIQQVITALKPVHAEGIVHRDIAPDNIFMLKDGRVKVIDFGAARYATTKHSKSLSVIIKPGYAPEEQYRSRGDQGPHTDVYALAATFYKMITGITPMDAMERSGHDTLRRPSKLGVAISKPMETALMNAMMISIKDRTPTMESFEQELLSAEVKEKRATKIKNDVGNFSKKSLVFVILGALIVFSGGYFALTSEGFRSFTTQVLKGADQTTVPNFVNLSLAKAQEKATEGNIKIVQEDYIHDAVIREGRVISQDTPQGEVVALDSVVKLVVSAGKEKVEVPKVVGMRIEDAREELKAVFDRVIEEPIQDGTLAPGTVTEQSMEAWSYVVSGGEITLKFNQEGYAADAIEGIADIEPSSIDQAVIGKNFADAQKEYKDQYFLSPTYEFSSEAEGVIVGIKEDGDFSHGKAAVIVSKGARQVMVPIVRNTLDEARKTLEDAGFVVEIGEERYDALIPAGNVIEQRIGDTVIDVEQNAPEGSTITLVVSKGAEPVQTAPETSPAQTRAPRTTEAATAPRPQATAAPQPQQTAAPTPAPTAAPTTAPPPPTPASTTAPPPPPTPAPTPAPTKPPAPTEDPALQQLDQIGVQ